MAMGKTKAKSNAGKWYRYEVVRITGEDDSSVRVGQTLLYRRAMGPAHAEIVMDLTTGKVSSTWELEYRGPCWADEAGKIHDKKPEGKGDE